MSITVMVSRQLKLHRNLMQKISKSRKKILREKTNPPHCPFVSREKKVQPPGPHTPS